ncbi:MULTISPECIES: helix-turn-helix domain-containing protein [unclassified Streptomyces]|uniref:helix-turn-helix domain-containing protein n=1 Tax=unclassified Streptomyces TaxID=2593676 RepID=UPI0016606D1B|nr:MULTISPECIES: helix-turn-helix domain-containing protein [unclassified Streptomyces]MBD0709518.1 AraC family transcriptional regulator [Streptomyces sp. CBMA291]MBD0718197.1 AraC family transcriptional regulator [Streptomyces sp. CBMA370]
MYEERPALLDGAVLWTRTAVPAGGGPGAVLPDGCMDLIWADGHLLVAGPDTRAYVPGETAARYAGIRFAPGDAPRVLGVPARELRDRRIGLGALWGDAEARRLADRITAAPDPAAALDALVRDRAAEATGPDPLLGTVVARLAEGRSVAATAREVGLGARQLHRRSLDAFGYGPKTLARVLRLQRALALVRAGLPYATAALRAGCADQAHLARETRALAGTTLSAYTASLPVSAKSETPDPSGSRTTA